MFKQLETQCKVLYSQLLLIVQIDLFLSPDILPVFQSLIILWNIYHFSVKGLLWTDFFSSWKFSVKLLHSAKNEARRKIFFC